MVYFVLSILIVIPTAFIHFFFSVHTVVGGRAVRPNRLRITDEVRESYGASSTAS